MLYFFFLALVNYTDLADLTKGEQSKSSSTKLVDLTSEEDKVGLFLKFFFFLVSRCFIKLFENIEESFTIRVDPNQIAQLQK